MSDLVERLRDADTTRRIGESYADTHERRQRDRAEAAARIEQLEAALRPLACTCKAAHQADCSRSEVDCPFWTARAAFLAMLEAWPGMHLGHQCTGCGGDPQIILPLPQEERVNRGALCP